MTFALEEIPFSDLIIREPDSMNPELAVSADWRGGVVLKVILKENLLLLLTTHLHVTKGQKVAGTLQEPNRREHSLLHRLFSSDIIFAALASLPSP